MVLLGLILVLLLAVSRITGGVIDLDLWHQLALARETVRLGHVPAGDLFAFTPTVNPSVNHEWGAGMIAYAVLSAGRGTAIMLLNALLAAITLSLAVLHAYRRNAEPTLVALLAFPALLLLARGFPPVRAQAYSYVFFAILLLALDSRRLRPRTWMVVCLPVFALWVNVHASFVLAFAIMGAYILESLVERRPAYTLLAAMAGMAVLALVNPYGAEMYSHLFRTLRMERPMISEWSAVWAVPEAPALLGPVAISLALAGYAVMRARPDVHGAAIVLMTAAAGCSHVKMLPYYAIAWLAFVPAWLKQTPVSAEIVALVIGRKRISQVIWFAGTTAALAGLLMVRFWEPRVPGTGESAFPVGAVNYLKQNSFRGNVMTRFNDGSYVIWKLYPQVKVSMDSRYDVAYPEWLCHENERGFEDAARWLAFAGRHGADAVIVNRGSPLESSIESHSWIRVYRDVGFGVYARRSLGLPVVDSPNLSLAGTLP